MGWAWRKKAPNISVILRSVLMRRKVYTFWKIILILLFLIIRTFSKSFIPFIKLCIPQNLLLTIRRIPGLYWTGLIFLRFLHDDSKLKLNSPVSRAEILSAWKSLNLNRSPGYDDLPVEFYIVFFHDICDLLLNWYRYSFVHGFWYVSQRNVVITLLPKKDKDPLYVKNRRPISLLNTDYKIIAKVMADVANRLKLCPNEIIHEHQTGFMKGRNIGSNIRTIIDLIIEYCNSNDMPGSKVLLHIEKAFDSVEQDYLYEVLGAFNFGSDFIKWIKAFYCKRIYIIKWFSFRSYIYGTWCFSGLSDLAASFSMCDWGARNFYQEEHWYWRH